MFFKKKKKRRFKVFESIRKNCWDREVVDNTLNLNFSSNKDVLFQILLYCRIFVEIVPAESIRVSMQLFKILFGSNVANLSVDVLRSLKLSHVSSPKGVFSSEFRTRNPWILNPNMLSRSQRESGTSNRYTTVATFALKTSKNMISWRHLKICQLCELL